MGGGGVALRFEWVPTAKRPHGVVNFLLEQKRGGQLQTKNVMRLLAYNLCLHSL